jgi:anti-sigma B factor antagonist
MTDAEPGVLHTGLRTDGPDVWVDTSGEIDLSTAKQLEKAIADGLTTQPARVYIDMHLVSFVDSVGLAVLVRCHRLAGGQGCQLIVHSPTRQVARTLALAGLDQYLTIET